jgi:serine/threonine protein kinase
MQTIFELGQTRALSSAHPTDSALPLPTVLLTNHDATGKPLPAPLDGQTIDGGSTDARVNRAPAAGATAAEPTGELCWNARYRIGRCLGRGAQGVVYLAEREGVDGYSTHVALKVFHRPAGWSAEEYLSEMRRLAQQGSYVSQIQHDNVISIRDFVALGENRVMVLEWIDGIDLSQLLSLQRLKRLTRDLPDRVRQHLFDVIVKEGRDHCSLKPGIAVDILRGCLAGLAALHNRGIVHCDLKPSNIMIKRTGTKKIIDIDSSSVLESRAKYRRGTPYYMAPEQLSDGVVLLQSDIASLGYVLIEMLTGQMLFSHCTTTQQLLDAKRNLPARLYQILPMDAQRDPILSELIRKMVAVDPRDRFPDADAAGFGRAGAARFERHLVKTNLSADYDRELAWWLRLLTESRSAKPRVLSP